MAQRLERAALGLRGGLAFAAGGFAVLVLRFWRGFFWAHAVIVGLAIAALVYSVWRTWDRMRG